jgi:chemotaxis protein MotB
MKNLMILMVLTLMVLAACVPPQKFKEVSSKSNKLEGERDQLIAENEQLTVQNTELKAKINMAGEQAKKYAGDSIRYEKEIEAIQKDYTALLRKYDDLESTHEALLQGSARESRRLLNELQTAQGDLDVKEKRLRELESTVNAERQDLTRLRAELEARNARLAEMQKILNMKDSAVNALKESVSKALMGFEGQGLSVQLKNGKVYVSLDEKLLFSTGSTVVDPRGVQALQKLSKVLEDNKDVNVLIEGHTDDVPFRKGSSIKDNWDLSVMRATAVVRILIDGSRIDPVRLTAAGRSEFLPVDRGNTPEARTKNRRTEIILTPKLDELFKILESN